MMVMVRGNQLHGLASTTSRNLRVVMVMVVEYQTLQGAVVRVTVAHVLRCCVYMYSRDATGPPVKGQTKAHNIEYDSFVEFESIQHVGEVDRSWCFQTNFFRILHLNDCKYG